MLTHYGQPHDSFVVGGAEVATLDHLALGGIEIDDEAVFAAAPALVGAGAREVRRCGVAADGQIAVSCQGDGRGAIGEAAAQVGGPLERAIGGRQTGREGIGGAVEAILRRVPGDQVERGGDAGDEYCARIVEEGGGHGRA